MDRRLGVRAHGRLAIRRIGPILLAVVLLGVLVPLAGAVSTSAAPSRSLHEGSASLVPGAPPKLSWPRKGQAAVALRGLGLVGSSPNEKPVPIASLTKMMTALVVLRDHPLQLGQQGPSVRITSPEVAEYQSETAAGDSTVPVATGENLSEYQLLEGLLLPSGDNLADVLAVFDAGSVSAFVAKMNETARVLGLFATHYVDTSGVNPASVSTADNQAIVASALMGYPVARAIVRQRHVRLPVAGVVPNWNPAIGVEGIIGVKSGWTSEAGSCLVTAAFRRIGHHSGLVISVTLGQPGGLTRPAAIDEELLATVTRSLVLATVLPGNSVVPDPVGSGQISLLAPSQPVVVLAWPGLLLETSISPAELNAAGLAASAVGSVVAELQVAAPWGVLATVPLRLGETPTVSSA